MKLGWTPTTWLCVAAAALLILAGCGRPSGNAQDEFEGAPGGFSYSEGTSAHAARYEDALDRLDAGEFAAAETIYRELIVLEPWNAHAHVGLGTSLLLQERLDEAEAAYTEAQTLSPGSAAALIGLGSVAGAKGAYETALERYEAALAIDDVQPNAHWGMAITLESLGREDEAAVHAERILTLAPESPLAVRAQQMVEDINGVP